MKIIYSALLIICIVCSCTVGIREEVIQKEDKSFLHFTGKTLGATVIIDDKDKILLEESKDGKDFSKKTLYQVCPGKHKLKIFKDNELIIERIIYIGNSETKEIEIQ